MSLTVGTFNIADVRIQGASIRPVLGAYELIFGLYSNVNTDQGGVRYALISGAEVTMQTPSGSKNLGFARPEIPIRIRTLNVPFVATSSMQLTLQPHQISAMEDARAGGDIDFLLRAAGEGMDIQAQCNIQAEWRYHIARSDWVEKLRTAGALNIMLIEIPLPITPASDRDRDLHEGFIRAQTAFVAADYFACVAQCRLLVERIAPLLICEDDWFAKLLGRSREDRNAMSKTDREASILAAIRHYTNQAHHSENDGGVAAYSRSEARLLLSLVAAFAARTTTQ